MVRVAAWAAVLLMAAAAGVVAGRIPGGRGIESGYSPPVTMVLVGADGRTLGAGYFGCAEDAALQAVETPGSVLLRVYWRRHRTFQCRDVEGSAAALSLNYQVRLSSPLAGRRLVGPDGVVLPWLDEAGMLTFRSPGRGYPYPAPVQSPHPVYEPMFPAAKCLAIQGGVDRMRLEQCAYGGAAAGATPTPGPAAGTRSGVALEGMPVTVRGRAGHVVEHRPNAPPWAGYEYSWRALWWIEDNRIVVLARERFPGDPPLASASELVAVANGLSCWQRSACR